MRSDMILLLTVEVCFEWSEFKNLVNLVVKEGCKYMFHIQEKLTIDGDVAGERGLVRGFGSCREY